MRTGIGSALIVLFFALIILGFLLSDTIDTHQELNAAREEIVKVQRSNQELQEQLNKVINDNKSLTNRNAELEQQILAWQEQVSQLEEQKQTLEEQKNTLEKQNQILDENIADLERQVITMQSASSNNIESPKKATNPLTPTFLVPFLPVTVAATYVVARQRTKNSIQKNQETRLNNTQGGNMVRLSDNEMKEIIRIRRGQ